MSPTESAAIAQLTTALNSNTDELVKVQKQMAVMHTKLFGEEDTENDQGRLPRLEAKSAQQAKQIARCELRLNRQKWMWAGISFVAGIIVTAAMFAYHVKQAFFAGH